MKNRGEQRLWCAVLLMALEDATGYISDIPATNAHLVRDAARSWLTKPSKDFDRVCAYAGFDPEQVRAFATKKIAEVDSGDHLPRRRKRRVSPAFGREAPRFTYQGQTLTLSEWAAETGIPRTTLKSRLRYGWPIERALTKPIQHRPRRGVGQDFREMVKGPAGEHRARSDENRDFAG